MFTHIMVGTNDLERSRKFYDGVLGALGLKRLGDYEKSSMWGDGKGGVFMATRPSNGLPAIYANGGTIGFVAPNQEAVDAFHKNALALGGCCEGPPGPRAYIPGMYAAYVRDPDGNKLVTSFVPR
jgi:catechol 2,3-dioxygenase-like lactoylglutathione lyase family enzyme